MPIWRMIFANRVMTSRGMAIFAELSAQAGSQLVMINPLTPLPSVTSASVLKKFRGVKKASAFLEE